MTVPLKLLIAMLMKTQKWQKNNSYYLKLKFFFIYLFQLIYQLTLKGRVFNMTQVIKPF